MSTYLEIARRFISGEDPEEPISTPATERRQEPPSLEVARPEEPAPVRRCFFCAAGLPEQPVYTGRLGGAFLCSRCGGWNYPETPRWIEEVTFRAVEANRRREVPRELSKRFSSAVLAGDEVGARQALAEIEAHTESGEEP